MPANKASFLQDSRYALRLLRKDPALVAMATLSLALGIASSTAVFSIFNGLFLRTLPYPNAERLVLLHEAAPSRNLRNLGVAFTDLHAWQQSGAFSSMAGFRQDGSYLTGFGPAVRVNVESVTQFMVATLGIHPILGRDFLPEEDRGGSPFLSAGGHRVVLLSYGFWQRYFGGAADAVGKTVRLDNLAFTVIGVLPRNAVYPADADVWTTLGYDLGSPSAESYSVDGIGRLKPGVTATQAAADLMRIHKGSLPARFQNRLTEPVVTPLREYYLGEYRTVTRVLLGSVALVLLIACLNVAGLILARGTARAPEFAIRAALGAGRGRLVRQLLVEGLVLASLGAFTGAALGWAAVRAVIALMPPVLPSWVDFRVDLHYLWLALGVTGTTALISALMPALPLSTKDIAALSGAGARLSPSRKTRQSLNALIVGEIAVAMVLLAGGGLVLKALHRVMSVAPGFRPDNVLTFSVDPPYASGPADAHRRFGYAQDLLARLRSTPGIEAAGMTAMLPLDRGFQGRGTAGGYLLQAEGAPAPDPSAPSALTVGGGITPGYFAAMGIPLLDGRDFDQHDSFGDGVAIVNQTLARHYWPGARSVIGKRLIVRDKSKRWLTIAGVVGDARYDGLEQPVRPQIFWPYPADQIGSMRIAARGAMDTRALAAAAREAARQADPNIAIFDVETMRELLDRSLWARRAYSWLFGGFAVIAVAMALAGIYGVVSYSVTQRTREIGIRMALGADRGQVVAEVLRAGGALVGAGAVLGVAGAWFATRLMTSILAGVNPHDPQTYAAVIALLAVAALLANLAPARRAASVDPVKALRFD